MKNIILLSSLLSSLLLAEGVEYKGNIGFESSYYEHDITGKRDTQNALRAELELKQKIDSGQFVFNGKAIVDVKDKSSGYTKQISWIAMDSFLLKQVEYYDRKSELLKTATFSEYKEVDGVWRVGKIEMKNHQNDKSTVLIWKEDKIHAGLTEKEFNKRVLKQ